MNRSKFLLVVLLPLLFAAHANAERLPDWPFHQPFMPHRARIGVHVQSMTPELREHFKVPSDRGLLVARVEPDRPAAQAGLQAGDVIIEANGKPMSEPFDLVKAVGRVAQGQTLQLRVIRDKEELVLGVKPEGEATPWIDPDYWSEWAEKGMRRGSERVRRQLEELQRRLEELERKFDEQLKSPEAEKQPT